MCCVSIIALKHSIVEHLQQRCRPIIRQGVRSARQRKPRLPSLGLRVLLTGSPYTGSIPAPSANDILHGADTSLVTMYERRSSDVGSASSFLSHRSVASILLNIPAYNGGVFQTPSRQL